MTEKKSFHVDLVFLKKYIALILFLVLLVINIFATNNFLSWITFNNFFRQVSRTCLVALGMSLVIATGGIDISVGSAMALGAVLAALGIVHQSPLLIILSIVLVIAFGCLAGVAVSKFAILPMVVTLALRYVMRGMARGISGAANVTYSAPKMTAFFTQPVIGQVPVHFFILLAAVIVIYVVVNKMKLGARIEAYGNNPVAARNCGINTVKIVIFCYAITAALSWMAGMLEAAVVSSAHPTTIGSDMEIDAIAAALIGGTPIDGGYPNIIGTTCGAFVLQLITMMCNMNNVSYPVTLMLKACIVLAALYFHGIGKRSR